MCAALVYMYNLYTYKKRSVAFEDFVTAVSVRNNKLRTELYNDGGDSNTRRDLSVEY